MTNKIAEILQISGRFFYTNLVGKKWLILSKIADFYKKSCKCHLFFVTLHVRLILFEASRLRLFEASRLRLFELKNQ